jgi:DNA repair protein RecN (Recombination protein N)
MVSKQQTNNTTTTSINTLNKKSRIQEIARMLGGIEVTQQTLAHAREMIDKSSL